MNTQLFARGAHVREGSVEKERTRDVRRGAGTRWYSEFTLIYRHLPQPVPIAYEEKIISKKWGIVSICDRAINNAVVGKKTDAIKEADTIADR